MEFTKLRASLLTGVSKDTAKLNKITPKRF